MSDASAGTLRRLANALGVGSVFLIGVGLLVLGVFVMFAQNVYRPAFFRGETLNAATEMLTEEDLAVA